MLLQLELFCLGFAAVINTVLLLVVVERTNRPLSAVWLKWALSGVTVWHVSSFAHVLLRETSGPTADWLDVACMTMMAGGLLLLNCGILHAGLRIHRTGAVAHPSPDRRYVVVYAPLLFLVAIAAGIARSGSRDFMAATQDFHLPWLVWAVIANVTAAALFLQSRHTIGGDGTAARFLSWFSVALILLTLLVIAYVLLAEFLADDILPGLAMSLSPLVPTLIFAWYVFQRRLLPLVLERTMVYGAILLAVFYLHRLTISPMMSRYSRQFEFDFVLVEVLLLVTLILAYHPLRSRVREGLRYLISGDVAELRDATHLLSVELSRRSGEDVESISEWFAGQIRTALKLQYTWLKISEPVELESLTLRPGEVAKAESRERQTVMKRLCSIGTDRRIDLTRCSEDPDLLSMMRDLELIAAFPIRYRNISGMLLLGTPLSSDLLSDEQLNATSILVDQFAATIHNRQLEAARQSAERRALQQEKLSVLGLLSGSLAHELRNPLSSMRTIATLLKEDLGPEGEHVTDIDLIVSEIDRLTETTQRLLDFSRPSNSTQIGVSPDRVIERLLHILGHLARQHSVAVDRDLQLGDREVNATDAALSDILFNLIKNAIEAVRDSEQRRICIATNHIARKSIESQKADNSANIGEPAPAAAIRVSDSGPGITPELRGQIFEPFVTSKTDGTGLGLYLVGQRVRELNGTISCRSEPDGTTFEVTLPLQETKD